MCNKQPDEATHDFYNHKKPRNIQAYQSSVHAEWVSLQVRCDWPPWDTPT